MTQEALTTFFAWSSAIHIGFLLFATVALYALGNFAKSVHGRLFAASDADLDRLYMNFLAGYKLLIIIFALVPYLVLRFAM
jgi:hypothetical protein